MLYTKISSYYSALLILLENGNKENAGLFRNICLNIVTVPAELKTFLKMISISVNIIFSASYIDKVYCLLKNLTFTGVKTAACNHTTT